MTAAFHAPQYSTRDSLIPGTGMIKAVSPTSALKLFHIGRKRRRGEGIISEGSDGREVDANRQVNHNISATEHEERNYHAPTSSLLLLVNNPFFSLPLGVTELAGPAGGGKTQIALSLCADCVQHQPGQQLHTQQQSHYQIKKKAVYIQLGGSSRFLQTASRRLEQMLLSRMVTNMNDGDDPAASAKNEEEIVHDCLTRILVHWICNSEELMELLRTSLPRLFRKHPNISLVVLDGIANLFRLLPEQEQQSSKSNLWHDRAIAFFQISNLCKELSSRYGAPFVILNECTSKISNEVTRQQFQTNATLEPALGLSWSQSVNCSFFVQRESIAATNVTMGLHQNQSETRQSNTKDNCNATKQNVSIRTLRCLKAPHISFEHSVARFWIDESGIISI